jgi:hypothetical protein
MDRTRTNTRIAMSRPGLGRSSFGDVRSLQRVDQRTPETWPDLSEHVDGDVQVNRLWAGRCTMRTTPPPPQANHYRDV